MTLFTYMTYAFVFVFLNTMHPSEGGCLDHLTNLTNVNLKEGFDLVIENRTVQMSCTLQRECKRGNGTGKACELLRDCFYLTTEDKILPECSKEDPVKVHFSHIMCLISGMFNSRACNYENVSKILDVQKQCTGSNLTTPATGTATVSDLKTTQTKTAAAPPPAAVSDPTTTQTTTTTTVASTTMKSKATAPAPSPNATSLDPDVSDPTTTQTTTTTVSEITTAATPTTGMLSTSEAAAPAQSPNATFQDPNVNLQRLLWLSMVFNVIVPVAVYLYVRRQWRRDKASYTSNGNSTEDEQNTKVALMLDAPKAFVNSNGQTSGLLQLDGYSGDDGEESELSGRPTRL